MDRGISVAELPPSMPRQETSSPFNAPVDTWGNARERGFEGSQASTARSIAAWETAERAVDPPYSAPSNGAAAHAAHEAGLYCTCREIAKGLPACSTDVHICSTL